MKYKCALKYNDLPDGAIIMQKLKRDQWRLKTKEGVEIGFFRSTKGFDSFLIKYIQENQPGCTYYQLPRKKRKRG